MLWPLPHVPRAFRRAGDDHSPWCRSVRARRKTEAKASSLLTPPFRSIPEASFEE